MKNIYREWAYISLWFFGPLNFSKKKYIRVKKKKWLENMREKIFKVFMNNSRILPIWQILLLDSYLKVLEFTNYSYSSLYRSWLHKYVPIPIHRKNNYSLITGVYIFTTMAVFSSPTEYQRDISIKPFHVIFQTPGFYRICQTLGSQG